MHLDMCQFGPMGKNAAHLYSRNISMTDMPTLRIIVSDIR